MIQAAHIADKPVAREERIASLDLLRGIAVLGILLANVTAFGHPDLAYYWPGALPGGGTAGDRIAWLVQFLLVDGKFRGLFTILFGAGLVLFVERAGASERAVWLQVRRLFWLALFGLAHLFLLFRGDILFSYACAGIVALFAISMPGRTALTIGIAWALAGAAMQFPVYGTGLLLDIYPGAVGQETAGVYREFQATRVQDAEQMRQMFSAGSYSEIVNFRWLDKAPGLAEDFIANFYDTIPLMLVGMGFYRLGVFDTSVGRFSTRAWAMAAFLVGLAGNLAAGLFALHHGLTLYVTQFVFFVASPLANIPMLVGGIYLLAQLARKPRDDWLTMRLAAAGRMAFSNYIGTSAVMMLIFQGWAGGLFGQLHKVELLVPLALGWGLMLAWSAPWLRFFRHGPLEWLWRCLTYWRLFPMRRDPVN